MPQSADAMRYRAFVNGYEDLLSSENSLGTMPMAGSAMPHRDTLK